MTLSDIKICRTKVLREILSRINTWDKGLETGLHIIDQNEKDLTKIKNYNEIIIKESSNLASDKEYADLINQVLLKMKLFLKEMEENKKILLDQKKDLGKHNDILTNYISSGLEAKFIDKNV